MTDKNIYLGKNIFKQEKKEVKGEFIEIDGERYYKIINYHQIKDFFISIVSNSDHWMFISSNGSLSAGRKNRDNALFPYYTEDKIHDYKGLTGSSSHFIVEKGDKTILWNPFTEESRNLYNIERNIYKSFYGNKIFFEEINLDLEISFRYGWCNSEKYGFVKKSVLKNLSKNPSNVRVLDGIKNVLPAGSDYNFQNEFSNLLDAYKKNELIKDTSIGLFTLSSIPVDRAEPSESLSATTVWSHGLKESKVLLSENQIEEFKRGKELQTEHDIRARRGAYYINSEITLKANNVITWITVAEINQDSAQVSDLMTLLNESDDIIKLVNDDIKDGTDNLIEIASKVDGLQLTNTELCYARHYSNALFNAMRGGLFINNYWVDSSDFKKYLWRINKLISKEYTDLLNDIPVNITYENLIEIALKTKNTDFIRIVYEYLPLTFSRRHGDPSRPWNLFSIETKNEDGTVKFNFEGNWRDIFQNWEALSYSFPEYTEGIISKFVNASTIDGYNPYRITRDGIDWEKPDPNDPWAYIGYWGDHQIIYLQKLLEVSENFNPGKIDEMLTQEIFVYANVPYRIKSFKEILNNPKDTIEFNRSLNTKISNEMEHLGSDAALVKKASADEIYKVNLTEKILVSLLSKLSNFIPEAGIWLNTQRPEWNDANNALVGNGTSMVTLYYLRRFLKFWNKKFNNLAYSEISISEEVAVLYQDIKTFLEENSSLLINGFSDNDRYRFASSLGKAHEKYRTEVYEYSFSGEKKNISLSSFKSFIKLCLQYIDQSIAANRRDDGLYHAYNLITIKSEDISIRYLYEMLEGQVAVLSAGLLNTKESLNVLDALKKSKMFREDQYSYMLYPDRELPRFTEKNSIPLEKVKDNPFLMKLMSDNEHSVIIKDKNGNYFFNKELRNADMLKQKLDKLKLKAYSQLIEKEKNNVLELYESVFDHQSFTGRSGTFYGYEGLGSIYWHMVSKLLLVAQECYFKAVRENADSDILGRLKNHYYEIKAGIGLYKSPELYGAFPTDAYSHTPGNAGVKQPGLTGQVKEDVISRFGELGLVINNGQISMDPSLLNENELLKEKTNFKYIDVVGNEQTILMYKQQYAFTIAQVPIIFGKTEKDDEIKVYFQNGDVEKYNGRIVNREISGQIFRRTNLIRKVEFRISEL